MASIWNPPVQTYLHWRCACTGRRCMRPLYMLTTNWRGPATLLNDLNIATDSNDIVASLALPCIWHAGPTTFPSYSLCCCDWCADAGRRGGVYLCRAVYCSRQSSWTIRGHAPRVTLMPRRPRTCSGAASPWTKNGRWLQHLVWGALLLSRTNNNNKVNKASTTEGERKLCYIKVNH